MRNIIKIGIYIVGIILIINAIESIDNFASSLLDYFERKSFEQYSYTKSPSLSRFILNAIGILLKLITGLILLIKPNIVNRFYIPKAYEENENNLPILLIWSFLYCFSVYLIINGVIELIHIVVRYFQFTSRGNESAYIKYQYLNVIPEIAQIAIGYYMNKYFQEKLYSEKFKSE